MKTNKRPSTNHKLNTVSHDAEFRRLPNAVDHTRMHCEPSHSAPEGARYEADHMYLDLRPVLPGAPRELGPAYLYVTVDSTTGQIVDANVRFGIRAWEEARAERVSHAPQLKPITESAFCRLLRPE